MNRDTSEARNSAAFAMSDGAATYSSCSILSGVINRQRSCATGSALVWALIDVFVAPGHKQLMLIPNDPYSTARARVSPITAAFEAQYAASRETPTWPKLEDTVMIFP